MKKVDLVNRLDEWLLEQKYKELATNTLATYRNGINHFIEWLESSEYSDKSITKDMTMEYKEHLFNLPNSVNSKNAWITAISKYFRWLVDDKKTPLAIKTFKQQQRFTNEKSLEIVDYKRMLRIAKRKGLMRTYYILKVLAMTGIRIHELNGFTLESLKNNKIYVKVWNKGKYRNVPLRQDLRRELLSYCKSIDKDSGYIFTAYNRTTMLSQVQIWRDLKKVAGLAKVNKSLVHAHAFRHLFARLYLEEFPEDALTLADLLGHSDLKTTRRYTTASTEQQRKKVERIKY